MSGAPACPSFGEENFGAAQLGDRRRTRSLVDLADRLVRHPGGSLPDKLADPNALSRCYDLVKAPQVTHAAVLAPHCAVTFERMRAHDGVALIVHDTTELDYTSRTSLHGQLGQIGNGTGKGYLCHNSLAVNPADRSAFGLVGQVLHVRDHVPKDETAQQKRDRESRESLLWLRGVGALEAAPPGRLWVDVCDCGGDLFELLDHELALSRYFLVRAWHERRIVVGHDPGGPKGLLLAHVRSLPEAGRRALHVPARDGRKARDTTVAVAFAPVLLRVPKNHRGHYRGQALAVWAVRVWEIDPPADIDEPVEWLLLTNVPVASLGEAWEKVDWYCCRWVIEEFHKAQKSGCAIEGPQFTFADRLRPLIALLSVVAVTLLRLRDRARDEQAAASPAEGLVDQEYVDVLSGWRYKERRPLSVREFFLALARLGGHQGRKGDGLPGWLVLWRGWQKLQLMAEGARAAQCPAAEPDQNSHNGGP